MALVNLGKPDTTRIVELKAANGKFLIITPVSVVLLHLSETTIKFQTDVTTAKTKIPLRSVGNSPAIPDIIRKPSAN
jgi:cysteine sulfinate desulfinase/cysteine desulfurase-like protein